MLQLRPKVLFDEKAIQAAGSPAKFTIALDRCVQPLRDFGFQLAPPGAFTHVEIFAGYPMQGSIIDPAHVAKNFYKWWYYDVPDLDKYDFVIYFTGHYFGKGAFSGGIVSSGYPKSRIAIYDANPHVVCHEIFHQLGAGHAPRSQWGFNVMQQGHSSTDPDADIVVCDLTLQHIETHRAWGTYSKLKPAEPGVGTPAKTLSDYIAMANYLFRNGPRPSFDMDVNKDGVVNMYDILQGLEEMFGGDDE